MLDEGGVEREYKFKIDGKTFRELQKINLPGHFSFQDEGIISVENIYFDTEDSYLGKNNSSFRVRKTDSGEKITFKSGGGSGEGKFVREEMEEKFTKPKLVDILSKLKERNLIKDFKDKETKEDIIRSAGLSEILKFKTERHKKKIIGKGESEMGEFVLDKVEYHGNNFFELEIEYGKESVNQVEEIIDFLRNKFDLSPSEDSKKERFLSK